MSSRRFPDFSALARRRQSEPSLALACRRDNATSCYVVGQDAIDLLVTAAVDLDIAVVDPSTSLVRRARDLDALGAVLLGRNVASVLADWGGEKGELLDELDEEEVEELAGYRESVRSHAHAPVVYDPRARVGFPQQVLVSCDNYAYQSEQDGLWKTSEARLWVDAITGAAIEVLAGQPIAGGAPGGTDALSDVPGMEDAHWSYQRGLEERTREEESQRSAAEMLARQTS